MEPFVSRVNSHLHYPVPHFHSPGISISAIAQRRDYFLIKLVAYRVCYDIVTDPTQYPELLSEPISRG